MKRKCVLCDITYNDFDHSTLCPHSSFRVSDSALIMLVQQGIMCPRCERHVDDCECNTEGKAMKLETSNRVHLAHHIWTLQAQSSFHYADAMMYRRDGQLEWAIDEQEAACAFYNASWELLARLIGAAQ